MAGDFERYQQSANAEPAKASPLSRFLDSNAFLSIVVLGLALLTFGWVIYPPLGIVWGVLNGAILIGILIVGIVTATLQRGRK
jgi:hypothetical protein